MCLWNPFSLATEIYIYIYFPSLRNLRFPKRLHNNIITEKNIGIIRFLSVSHTTQPSFKIYTLLYLCSPSLIHLTRFCNSPFANSQDKHHGLSQSNCKFNPFSILIGPVSLDSLLAHFFLSFCHCLVQWLFWGFGLFLKILFLRIVFGFFIIQVVILEPGSGFFFFSNLDSRCQPRGLC